MGWGIAFAVLAIIAVAVAWLDYGRNKEVVGAVEVSNPEGKTGAAFVVYHPGKSDFQRRVFSGFMEGLVCNGWPVESTTPSAQTPMDLSASIFWSSVAPPTGSPPIDLSGAT